MELVELKNDQINFDKGNMFHALTVIDGKIDICTKTKKVELNKGHSLLVSSVIENYSIVGSGSLLVCYCS